LSLLQVRPWRGESALPVRAPRRHGLLGGRGSTSLGSAAASRGSLAHQSRHALLRRRGWQARRSGPSSAPRFSLVTESPLRPLGCRTT